jgi:diketogulonate reductase-like aldo/keto reductase
VDAMEKIRLGCSNLQVSRIAFGTWQLGGDWGATDEAAAVAAIRDAADQGINFFDTTRRAPELSPPSWGSTKRLIPSRRRGA